MSKHVSCSGCHHIWHDNDLNDKGRCPDCQKKPQPEPKPPAKETT